MLSAVTVGGGLNLIKLIATCHINRKSEREPATVKSTCLH